MYPLFGILLSKNTTKWKKPSLPPNNMIKPISVCSSKIEPLTSSGNAAPHLQRTTLVGNRQATHLFGATMSAGVAVACPVLGVWDYAGSAARALQAYHAAYA